jgi:hypothetical protein
MITTEEIAVIVRDTLLEDAQITSLLSDPGDQIDYERSDYSTDGIIILPRTIQGEGSVRNGQINVNIHVPDLKVQEIQPNTVYRTNFPRLIELKKAVIDALKNHFESGEGWNWSVGLINPPMKEQGHDEHFVSIALEIVVRQKNNV